MTFTKKACAASSTRNILLTIPVLLALLWLSRELNCLFCLEDIMGLQIDSEVCRVTRVKIISRFLAEMSGVKKLVYK